MVNVMETLYLYNMAGFSLYIKLLYSKIEKKVCMIVSD